MNLQLHLLIKILLKSLMHLLTFFMLHMEQATLLDLISMNVLKKYIKVTWANSVLMASLSIEKMVRYWKVEDTNLLNLAESYNPNYREPIYEKRCTNLGLLHNRNFARTYIRIWFRSRSMTGIDFLGLVVGVALGYALGHVLVFFINKGNWWWNQAQLLFL